MCPVRKKEGFTLIELMIVVAIIGILAAIAIPSYLGFVMKTKRSEVKVNLGAIHSAEISYFSENDTFSPNFNDIRWLPLGTTLHYTYSVGGAVMGKGDPVPGWISPGAGTLSFSAYGWGNIDNDLTEDVWKIDETKQLEIVGNDYYM